MRVRAAAAIALAIAGCGGDKSEPTASTAPAAAVPAIPPAQLAADLAMLPSDAELVIGLDVAALVASPVWQQLVMPLLVENALADRLAELKTRCGIDPLVSVKAVTLGMKGLGAASPEGVIVIHGLAKQETTGCLDRWATPTLSVARDGEITTLETPRGDRLGFRFTTDRDTVIAFGGDPIGTLKAAVTGSGKLATTPQFAAQFARLKPARSAWMVMDGRAKAFELLAALGLRPVALAGSADIADGLALDVGLAMANAEAAERFAALADKQVKPLGSILALDRIEIAAAGDVCNFAAAASQSKLPAVVKQLRAIVSGRMGRAVNP